MADFGGLFRNAARRAGRTVGRVEKQLSGGRMEGSLPQDESGQVRIVCRRYAEKRAVSVTAGKPSCFEAGDPDCESCLEDISDGTVETW
ncbi:DUF7091 family protein [Halodesulfurarchaeum sp.]|uniref:DUF7091 family protein n=1 Tax=Halodesulfurarchaeum sp. TaxID=1980530 RepID=UPI001BB88CFF|nr:hypothetical protein [Halodesulfurarchaeum sp.]